jgi:hypothetical protein
VYLNYFVVGFEHSDYPEEEGISISAKYQLLKGDL